MLGIGSQPLGTSTAGGSVLPVDPLPPNTPGARLVDVNGNAVIDPVTGDFMRADPVTMQVYLALRTTLGAASGKPSMGATWPKKMGSRFEAEVNNTVGLALSELIRSKTISLEGVDLDVPMPEVFFATVRFRNLVTQKSEQVRI